MKYAQPWDQPSNPNASYIDGDQAAGIEGSIIPAAGVEDPQRELVKLITDVGLTAPTDLDLTQVSYATRFMRTQFVQDLGVPNNIAVALNPSPIVWGTPLSFFVQIGPGNTNTSSVVTCALTGIPGTRNVVKHDGSPVQPGDFSAGGVALFAYDGFLVRCMSFLASDVSIPAQLPQPISGAINLNGQSTGNLTAQWTCEQLTFLTALGGNRYFAPNLTLNFNGATTGVNGMDTGSMPIRNDLSVYAIYNPTTQAVGTLGCAGAVSRGTVYTGSNMPAGYTASTLIHSQVTRQTSGYLQRFIQHDRTVWISSFNVLTNGTSTAWAAINLSAAVPYNTKWVAGNGDCEIVQSGVSASLSGDGAQNTGYQWFGAGYGPSSSSSPTNYGDIPLITPQTIYYYVNPAGAVFSCAIDRYGF
jgi:hypothetical protein